MIDDGDEKAVHFLTEACREKDAEIERLEAEVERLRTENEKLRRWKALDKPLTAAMEIANSHLASLQAEIERLRAALQDMIEITKRNSNADLMLIAIRGCAKHALGLSK